MKKTLSLLFVFFILFTCGCNRKTYTATFKNFDGAVLKSIEVPVGEAPSFDEIPERVSDDLYDYTFYSWDKDLIETDVDTTFTAIYISSVKSEEEEVVYVNDFELDDLRGDENNELLDNSMLSQSFFVTFLDDDNHTILQKTQFKYGTTPYFESGGPASKIVGDYLYTFTGWDKTFTTVKGEQTYVAQYKKEKIQKNDSLSSSSSSSSSSLSPQNQGNYITTSTDKVLDYNVVLNAYDISNNQEGGGTFSGDGSYKANARVYIEAKPNKGMHFVKWSDGDTSISKTFIINSDVEYTAYFEKDNTSYTTYYRVTVISSDSSAGIVSISPNRSDSMFEEGEYATISATPRPGYIFKGWLDFNGVEFGTSTEYKKTFEIKSDGKYTAVFAKDSSVEEKKEKEDGKVTISANIDNNKIAYVTINDDIKTSANVDVGSNVKVTAYLTSSSAKFLGWSLTGSKTKLDTTEQTIYLNSVQKDTNVYGYTESNGSDDVVSGDDPAPEIITIDSIIKSQPDGACSFIVNGSNEIPSSFKLGERYNIKFVQTEEQMKNFTFTEWAVGSKIYKNKDLDITIDIGAPSQIIAYFTNNNDYSGTGGEEGSVVSDYSSLKIGDVLTFNDNDVEKFLLIDSYNYNDKLIGKFVPINFDYKTQYSFNDINKTSDFENINLMSACTLYANNLSNPILRNHLFSANVNIYDYLNVDNDCSYNVHKSIINNAAEPIQISSYKTSCYPLGLGDFDKLYTYKDKKGIYSSKDLEYFISLTTGNSNNSIWFKDLLSFGANSLKNGICITKDGISDTNISSDINYLPVLVVDIDSALKIKILDNKSLKKTNKYTIKFKSNDPEYGNVEVNNRAYNNIFEENEQISFEFINKNSALYNFNKWNDGNTEPKRTITAKKDFEYIGFASISTTDFNKKFDIIPYIKSNGNQYINTAYIPTKNTKLILQYEPIVDDNIPVSAICGVKDNTNVFDLFTSFNLTDHKMQYKLTSNSKNKTSDSLDSSYKQLTIQPNKLTIKGLNGDSKEYSINSELTFANSNLPLYLFASNVNNIATGLSKMKLYSCKIYEGDELVRDMIPVYNKTTTNEISKYGLYDLIDSIYYPSIFTNGFEGPNKDDLLFSNYKQLDYIQNNGESFIDTGVIADPNTGFSIEFMPLSRSTASYIGIINGESKLALGTSANTTTSNYFSLDFDYKDSSKTNNIKLIDNYSNIKTYVSYNFFKDGNIFYSIDNKINLSKIETPNLSKIDKNIYLGTANGDSNVGPVRIYSAYFTNNKAISHFYVPVETEDATKYGLLDIYDQKFIHLTETSFSKNSGPDDISDYEILPRVISDGKAFIDTDIKFNAEGTTGIKATFIPLGFNDAMYIGALGTNNYIAANLNNTDEVFSIDDTTKYENKYVIKQGESNPVTVRYNYLNSGDFKTFNSKFNLKIKADKLKANVDASNSSILIGHVNDDIKNQAPAIYYNVTISEGKKVIQYFVPAKKKNTTEIGFYDVVDDKFYKPDYSSSKFIDGSFADNGECTITSSIEAPVILNRTLYSDSNLSNKISDATETQKCPFLSTLSLDAVLGKDKTDNRAYVIDKWSDNGFSDEKRNIIAYSPNPQTYSASKKSFDNFSNITINYVDTEGKAVDKNHVKVTYKIDNQPITDGVFYPGDKIQVEMEIGGVDGYEKTHSTDLYKWNSTGKTNEDKKTVYITLEEDEKDNVFTYTLYPAQTFFRIKVVDAEDNELPINDFNCYYYSNYNLSRSNKFNEQYKLTPKTFYPDLDGEGVEMIVGLNEGDKVYTRCVPKTEKKYMTKTANPSVNSYLYPKTITKVGDYNYKTYTFINYIEHGDDLVKCDIFDGFAVNGLVNIRNSSGWKYTKKYNKTPVDENLEYESINNSDKPLKVGDIVRYLPEDITINGTTFKAVNNTINFQYPLYCNTTGKDLPYWNHTVNLYRVIKIKGDLVELMDLTCRDQLLINQYEINRFKKGEYNNIQALNRVDPGKNIEDYKYKTQDPNDSTKEKNVTYELKTINTKNYDDEFLRISKYLLMRYYDDMPEDLKDSIVPQDRFLCTYSSDFLHYVPYLIKIEMNSNVYLLGLRDILDYIGYDRSKSYLKLNDEEMKELYNMFGFSNKFLDYSSFRYLQVPVNFLIWDFVTLYSKKILNDNTARLNDEAWLNVSLVNINDKANGAILNDEKYYKAAITCDDYSTIGIQHENFDIIRPCFTIDMSQNYNYQKFKRVVNKEYLETNFNSDEITYKPS